MRMNDHEDGHQHIQHVPSDQLENIPDQIGGRGARRAGWGGLLDEVAGGLLPVIILIFIISLMMLIIISCWRRWTVDSCRSSSVP